MLTWQVEYPASFCFLHIVVAASLHLRKSTQFNVEETMEEWTFFSFFAVSLIALDQILKCLPTMRVILLKHLLKTF